MCCLRVPCDDRHLLEGRKVLHASKTPEGCLDNRFVEACQMLEDIKTGKGGVCYSNYPVLAEMRRIFFSPSSIGGDNICKVLIYFDQLYGKMNSREKRQLMEELISEI